MDRPPPVEVVLVEDSPADAELTLRAFSKHNLSNRIAVLTDGEAALDFFFGRGAYAGRDMREAPRLVLLDLKLPKIDGIEVLRALKADPQTGCIPVVMLTSSGETPDIAECYRLGASSYIVKPVGFENFTAAVRDIGFYWLLLNRPPAACIGRRSDG